MSVRTFLALDLDDYALDRLCEAQADTDAQDAKINWVRRDNLHLTLTFLGDVPDEMLKDVCDIAGAAAGQVEPFDFEVKGISAVPSHGPLRMFWAGVIDPTGRLAALHEELARGLEGLRLRQEDRTFKPHITLARIKYAPSPQRLRQWALGWADKDFGLQHADELVAYASQLTSEGSVYTPIARMKLG